MDAKLGRGKEGEVISVSPFRCRMWKYHDRLEEYLTEETCRAEILSTHQHGQVVAALGRRTIGDPDCDVELIYGARRLFVARHLNRPLVVRLRELSDREALIQMDVENRQRKDISPYERGLSYARWLRAGLFASQDEIARALHISPATVSRSLRITRLPSVVLNAFSSPLDIAEDWGLRLADALENLERRAIVLRRARAMTDTSPRPPARIVYARLTGDLGPLKPGCRDIRDEVVLGSNGRPLFRIRRTLKVITLCVPTEVLTASRFEAVKQELRALLEIEESHQPGPNSHFTQRRKSVPASLTLDATSSIDCKSE